LQWVHLGFNTIDTSQVLQTPFTDVRVVHAADTQHGTPCTQHGTPCLSMPSTSIDN
jgi:hypothetical protein